MRESFAIVQRTVRSAESVINIQFEPEAVTLSRRKHLSYMIEEACKLQKEMQTSLMRGSDQAVAVSSVLPGNQADPRDTTGTSEEEQTATEQVRGVINADYIGLMDAALDDDEYKAQQPESSSESTQSDSNSASGISQYNLRPGKTVIVIADDQDDETSESESPSHSEAGEQREPESLGTTNPVTSTSQALLTEPKMDFDGSHPSIASYEAKYLSLPKYKNDIEEQQLITSIICCATGYWSLRLRSAFKDMLGKLLPTLDSESLHLMEREFEDFITPNSKRQILTDSYAFHYHLGASSHPSKLFNFQAWCVLSAGCSESSCERIFSLAKWIVGERRCRLKLQTISHLLHILCNSQYYQ